MNDDERAKVARTRAEKYAATPLSVLLVEAAEYVDCRCRFPAGNGPPCRREQLATELRTRAAEQPMAR